MKTIDVSQMIVVYNFIIGILIMLSSEKLGVYAGHVNKVYGPRIARLTRISTFTFGACAAVLSGSVYLVWHLLRISV